MFKPTSQHSFYVRALYKRILSEAGYFFDDRSRAYVVNRARKFFKEYKSCQDESRIKSKLTEAKKRLHRLESANKGNQKSALKVLEAAYGRTGKVKHKLMHSYLYEHFPADFKKPAPLIPHIPHTAPPPPLCYPLQAIVTQHLKKQLEPQLPVPPFKPLHRGRQANLLWKWRSMLIQQMEIPLPFEIICELELKAGASMTHPCYSGMLNMGGPRWIDMYAGHENDPDLAHLCPIQQQTPLKKLETNRCIPLPPSPYTKSPSIYATSTLIAMSPLSTISRYQYAPREMRRLYRRLLNKIPLISPLPDAMSLYDANIKYQVSQSQWATNTITHILDLKHLPPNLQKDEC
ncbi:uncharacterized protein BX664DRAFT_342348 [Halteromyces radiatus]|uniref:uncharacterized protein n=1 Tax=Halteromyces radiatus TaxID=101107 RepID=UPI00221EF562|nr:uncharacterized protein BX664DRAFT_342348 [Halteromyces radiatus]KAI8078634.1 hypothetical protein BX664DRAFT_342348 [Halteromyces radiatus]